MNYWLSPQGQVWESEDMGNHYEMAIEIIIEKFPDLLDKNILEEHNEKLYQGNNATRDLEAKGYIRYMDWGCPSWVVRGRKPTKIQIRKMFDLMGFIYKE